MKQQLLAKYKEIKANRNLDVDVWIQKKADYLNEYLRRSGLKAVVVNVSGGIDSALTIKLADYAKKQKNSPIQKVLGIVQPIKSTPEIISRAIDFLKDANIDYVVIDQSQVFDLILQIVNKSVDLPSNLFATGQLKSYMRTPIAFYLAQLLSVNGKPAIVLGTGNYDEDGYLYYFCKAGDGTNDVQLIHDLHKSEVNVVARKIGVPDSILNAPPSADLWPGQTDQNEIGFSYDFVELYTELLINTPEKDEWIKTLDEENLQQWNTVTHTIESIHQKNKHKESWPVNLDFICPNGHNSSF
jgi:NAD+ synthase (glutamine-hydrolysing)